MADLTDAEAKLCMDTWAALSDNLSQSGEVWFTHMFKTSPHMKSLYRFLDHYNGNPADNPGFDRHVMRVMRKVDITVSQLDQPWVMSADLKALGARHPAYKVIPGKHVKPTKDSFLVMLKSQLGSKFNAEAEAAWSKCFDILVSIMFR